MNVSGSGKGHGACALWAIMQIVIGIIAFVAFRWLAIEYGYTQEVRAFGTVISPGGPNEFYTYFMVCGIVLPLLFQKQG